MSESPLSLCLPFCLFLFASREVKRSVNRQARKRARVTPRRHLTLPLGEEVLLPLFKAVLRREIYRVFRSVDASLRIKALNINGAGKQPENYSRFTGKRDEKLVRRPDLAPDLTRIARRLSSGNYHRLFSVLASRGERRVSKKTRDTSRP